MTPLILAAVFACQYPLVHDGDTFRCAGNVKVRLWGIDAPELQTPAGPPARNAAARIINGQTLTCEPKGKSWDRTVALCRLPNGTDIAAEMVKGGFAKDWPKFSGGFYSPK